MESLLDVPPKRPNRIAFIACGAAVLAHGVAAAAAATLEPGEDAGARKRTVLLSEMIELEEPPPPAPKPPPPPMEEEPPPPPKMVEKAARPAPVPEARSAPQRAAAAAPAAAQATRVLAQDSQDEVLDFGETIVQGDSTAYAGGAAKAGGTSARAVRITHARAGGIEGGTGTDVSGVDRSRSASLAGGAVWDCPFPEEADDEGINGAVVTLRVRVALDGTLQTAEVARDPGAGFGREARRCARDKRWQPARDRAGNPIASESTINVRFLR
jgi:protein TonB